MHLRMLSLNLDQGLKHPNFIMFLGIQHPLALHPGMVVRGCGLLWLILGENGISFSRNLGRGFSACITLRFSQQNTFWIRTWFFKHRQQHDECKIKPGVCSVNNFTTVQLRMAKCLARETVRLPQCCSNTAGVGGSLCFPPVGADTTEAGNTWHHPHIFICVGWRCLWRGRSFGLRLTLWVGCHATEEQTLWGTGFLLVGQNFENSKLKTEKKNPVQCKIPACKHWPSYVHYKILCLSKFLLSAYQTNPNSISLFLFFLSLHHPLTPFFNHSSE